MDSVLQAFQELNLLDNGISYVNTVDKTGVVSPVRLVSIAGIVHVDTACDHVLASLENIPGAVTDCVPIIPESGSVSDPHNDFPVRDVDFRETDPVFGPLSAVPGDGKNGVVAAGVSALVNDVSGDIVSPSPNTHSISPPVIRAVRMGDGQQGSNLDRVITTPRKSKIHAKNAFKPPLYVSPGYSGLAVGEIPISKSRARERLIKKQVCLKLKFYGNIIGSVKFQGPPLVVLYNKKSAYASHRDLEYLKTRPDTRLPQSRAGGQGP